MCLEIQESAHDKVALRSTLWFSDHMQFNPSDELSIKEAQKIIREIASYGIIIFSNMQKRG